MNKLFVYRIFHGDKLLYVGKAETKSLPERVVALRSNPQFVEYCRKHDIEFSEFTVDYMEFDDHANCDIVRSVLIYNNKPELNAAGKPDTAKVLVDLSLPSGVEFVSLDFSNFLFPYVKTYPVLMPLGGKRQLETFCDQLEELNKLYYAISAGEKSVTFNRKKERPLCVELSVDMSEGGENNVVVPTGSFATVDLTGTPVYNDGIYEYQLLYGDEAKVFLPAIRMDAIRKKNQMDALITELTEAIATCSMMEALVPDEKAEEKLWEEGLELISNYGEFIEWTKGQRGN